MIKPKEYRNCANEKCGKEFKKHKTTDKWCSRMCYLVWYGQQQIEERRNEYKVSVNNKAVFNDLQDEINKTVRLIDRGHDCITSGLKYGSYVVNAGHYFSVGSNPAIRYNLLNIFNQSQNDNSHKGGKGSNYGLRLKEVFGSEVRDEIEGLVAKYPYLGLKHQQAREKLKIVREINRELSAIDITFSTEYRIEVRRKLNERIGIYK